MNNLDCKYQYAICFEEYDCFCVSLKNYKLQNMLFIFTSFENINLFEIYIFSVVQGDQGPRS